MKANLTRRELIRRSLRLGGLGAIGGVAALLSARSGKCATSGPCGGCPLFEGCALPKAKAAQRPMKAPTDPSRDD